MAATDQWYWCFEHQIAELEGEQCRASNRLGPFASEEAARNWRSTNEDRETAWKKQDEEWEGDSEAPGSGDGS